MEYRRDAYIDGNIDEQYIGTPEEIIKLIQSQTDEEVRPSVLDLLRADIDILKERLETYKIYKEFEEGMSKIKDININNKELVHDQGDAINFIQRELGLLYGAELRLSRQILGGNKTAYITNSNIIIKKILEAEEDYMRSVGIIED